MDPSLDSMLMDCRAAVDLIYMQVRVTKNHRNTVYYRPFGFETFKKLVVVKNSTSLSRRGTLIGTESRIEVTRGRRAEEFCIMSTEFLLGVTKKS